METKGKKPKKITNKQKIESHDSITLCCDEVHKLIIKHIRKNKLDNRNGWLFMARVLNSLFRNFYGAVINLSDETVAKALNAKES